MFLKGKSNTRRGEWAMTQAQADAIETELDEEEAWDEYCEWWAEFGGDS